MSPIQSLQAIGVAPETIFGTFVAPTKYIPGSVNIQTNQKLARPAQARASRSQQIDAIVGQETQATVTGELIPEAMSLLIAQWFGVGADTVTGASTAKTHTLVPKNALGSVSLEVDNDVATQLLARQIVGCLVDQMVVHMTNQALSTAEFTLVGQRETTPATIGQPSNASPSESALQPFDFSELSVTYRGGAQAVLLDATLTAMNHVQRVFSATGQLYAARLVPTLREIQLQTTLDFLTTAIYSDWAAGVNSGASPQFTFAHTGASIAGGGNYAITLNVGRVRASGVWNLTAASDVLQQQVSWSVTQVGADEFDASIVNTEVGALA